MLKKRKQRSRINKCKLRKGDQVIVRAGRDKNRRGTITKVIYKTGKVLVEGINVVKKHTRADPNRNIQGGIVEKEAPMEISNVAIFNAETNKADRIGYKYLEDGTKVRYFKSTDEVIDV